jgi:transcription factor WhiB
MDPNMFALSGDEHATREAKRVCQLSCPVKSKCLATAIIYKEVGVWGGYLESERRYISKASRRRLMAIAILEDNLDPKLIRDTDGVEMYHELIRELEIPNRVQSNTGTYSGPMAA